jgi:DNA-binding CsgD family transcriptional regulator
MRTTRAKERSPSGVRPVTHELYQPDPSLSVIGASSSIGVAVFDRKLHFCAINRKLAKFNRFPPKAHLGKPLDPFVGELTDVIGSRIERVFSSERPIVGYEVSGKLPKRNDVGFWIEDYVPILNRRGRIVQVCALVVEVTPEKRLEQKLSDLRNRTLRQLRSMTGWNQQTLRQCLRWIASHPASQTDVDRNLEAFRQLERGYQRILADLTAALPAAPKHTGRDVAPRDLSLRQRTVVQLLAKGESPKEIAALLNLSPSTVEIHKFRLFKKLGFDSLADLIRYAIKTGLVEL